MLFYFLGAAVLRYLRSTYDFFGKFLEIHPWSADSSRLEHQTEFLQLLALELLVTSRANLTSYLQRLLVGLAGPNRSVVHCTISVINVVKCTTFRITRFVSLVASRYCVDVNYILTTF